MVAVEMSDEDFSQPPRAKAASHELNLAPLSTVKHPEPDIWSKI